MPQQDLQLKITWKMHMVLCHIGPFCEKNNCGLARFAEQTIESVHAKFKSTWARYKVSSIHSGHGDCLKNAVADFGIKRI